MATLLDSVNNKLDAFNDLFLTCLNDHAAVKTVKLRHKPNPFITDAIRDLMKARDRTHERAKRTKSEEDWGAFTELPKEVKVALRKAEQDHFNQEIASNKKNSGQYGKSLGAYSLRNQ